MYTTFESLNSASALLSHALPTMTAGLVLACAYASKGASVSARLISLGFAVVGHSFVGNETKPAEGDQPRWIATREVTRRT